MAVDPICVSLHHGAAHRAAARADGQVCRLVDEAAAISPWAKVGLLLEDASLKTIWDTTNRWTMEANLVAI